jgi:cytochrome P450
VLAPAITLAELEGPDAHLALARLREQAPVAWVEPLGAWLVTRRDVALQVMRDDETFTVDDPRFSTARVVGPSMLSSDGAEHARHRAPFARRYRLAAVRGDLSAVVEDEAARLLDALAPHGRCELRREFSGPLAAAVVMRSLGLDRDRVPDVLGWYETIVAAVDGAAAGRPVPPAAHAAFAELAGAVAPGLDAGGITGDEAVSNAAVIMFGGIDTTDGMIANAAWHLLSHPGALAAVRADPALLPAAVEESLRLQPAAASVDRYATRDVELAGAHIRAGDLVSVSLAAANRDPDVFEDPDRFDPTRSNLRQHVAFAHGPHVCLGMHLARLEGHTALRLLLERLPNLRADERRPVEVRGIVFRKPLALHLLWD